MDKQTYKYVLLVEDNPTDWKVFYDLLTQLGLTVIENENKLPVASYEEAVRILKKSGKHIEYAVLDMQLAGTKNGADIADFIITNDYPIRIIFTTANLDEPNAKNIASVGPQYGVIVKPQLIVNKEISLFQLRQLLMPSNPLLLYKKDVLWLNVQKLDLHPDRKKQVFPRYEGIYPMQAIAIENVAFICNGTSDIYNIPKNYCLFISSNLSQGFYIRYSLINLIREKFDERFVQVNENVCINIMHTSLATPSLKKQHIVIGGVEIKISKTYRSAFLNRLTTYGLL
jgi:CheY-like chemotaxis protein